MKNPFFRSSICLLTFLAVSLSLCAQTQSSIYLDSRDVANYIRKVQDPYMDVSKVKDQKRVKVFQNLGLDPGKDPMKLPPNMRLPILENDIYTLVLDLKKEDTVFIVGRQRRFITHESSDTIRLRSQFNTDSARLAPLILFRDTSTSFSKEFEPVLFGPADANLPLKVVTKLASHLYYKKAANKSLKYYIDKRQLAYATNPFMANTIMARPSIAALNWNELGYINFSEVFSAAYPWQAVLDGDSTLRLNQLVSIEDQRGSYRDQIISSEKALSIASQQINQTSRQGGLFDARTVAVGMSDFIAERAQEELNLTFFERFKDNMRDTNELSVLFPKTRDLLLDFEISNYKTLLSHARISFETDLGNIGLNFPKILSMPKYEELKNDHNVFNLALIYSLADLAYKEYPVEDILLYACQSLDQRNSELEKFINLQIVDRLIDGRNPNEPDFKLDSLEILSKVSTEIINNSAQETILHAYTILYLLAQKRSKPDTLPTTSAGLSRLKAYTDLLRNEGDALYAPLETIVNELDPMLFLPDQSERVETYLKGKKYFKDLIKEYDKNEAVFNRVFTNGKGDPIENYSQGLAYVKQLKDETYVPRIRKQYKQLKHYVDKAKAIEAEYLVNSNADSSSFEGYFSNYEKGRLFFKAIELESNFWHCVRDEKMYDNQDIVGLAYLRELAYDKFPVFYNGYSVRDSKLYYKEFEEPEVLSNNVPLEEGFKKRLQTNHSQIDQNIEKYKQLLEVQIDRIYLSNCRGNGQELLSIKDTFYNGMLSLNPARHKHIIDSIIDVRSQIIKEKEDIIGYTELSAKDELYPGSVDSKLLDSLANVSYELAEVDPSYQMLSSFMDKNPKGEIYQKTRTLYDNWERKSGGISKDSFPVLEAAARNPYLQQLDLKLKEGDVELLDEQSAKFFYFIDSKMADVEPAISEVIRAKKQLNTTLNALENQYCKDLVEAKFNATNLHTALELSMQLLSAFRNPATHQDSMFIKDSILIALEINRNDIKRSYDSLVVRKRYVSDKDLELPGSRWISRDTFNALKKDPLQWDIFLGMLYERMRQVDDAPDFSASGVALLATKFFDIIHEMDEHRQQMRLKKALKQDIGFSDYYPFIKSTVDLFNTVINTPTVGKDKLAVADKFKDIRKVSEISDAALSMYENIYMKNYSNAIRNSMSLFSILTHSEYDPGNPLYPKTLRAELNHAAKEGGSKKQSRAQRASARKTQRAINAVLIYGTFMADMIDAQTSEQVKNILKSATLPPGSSRIKREVTSNFTINSYLGGAVAYDRIQENLPGLQRGSFGASVSVPVGFTYSFSPDKIFKRGGSFSIHVPIIDLGAITAFRSNPSSDDYQIEQLPEFTWRNLFAPGAFFIWNIRNSPFSLGVGGQIGPQLRQIKDLNTSISTSVNSTRLPMVFFSVDVPFFNLYTGAKKIVVD